MGFKFSLSPALSLASLRSRQCFDGSGLTTVYGRPFTPGWAALTHRQVLNHQLQARDVLINVLLERKGYIDLLPGLELGCPRR